MWSTNQYDSCQSPWMFADLSLNAAGIGLFYRNVTSGEISATPEWSNIVGIPLEKLPKTIGELFDLIHPDDLQRVKDAIQKHLNGDSLIYEEKYRIRGLNGSYTTVLARGKRILKEGEIIGLAGAHMRSSKYEDFYESILDFAPQMIFVKDNRGTFRFGNRAIAEFLATTKDRLLGTRDEDYQFLPDQIREFLRIDKSVLDTGMSVSGLIESARGPDSVMHWLQTEKREIVLPDGTKAVLGISTFIDDLMVLKKDFEQQRQLFEVLMENMPDAIYFKKPTGEILYMNNAMGGIVGMSSSKAIGLRQSDIFAFDKNLADILEEEEANIIAKKTKKIGLYRTIVTKSGETRISLTDKVPVLDANGAVTVLAVISRNVTPLVKAELEAKQSEQRAKANEVWGKITKGLAHSMRNNLAAITANLSEIIRKADNPDEVKTIAKNMFAPANESIAFVNELLNYKGVESLSLAIYDITSILKECAVKHARSGVCIRMDAKDAIFARVDKIRLTECLDEFVHNSVYWCGAVNREVDITLSAALTEPLVRSMMPPIPGKVIIRYSDNGPGVPDGEKSLIFDIGTSHRPGGCGLGLFRVAEILDAHRGTIQEVGQYGKGALFEIVIPR